jgi:hypothetical protein
MRRAFRAAVDLMFGCGHARTTFPQTEKRTRHTTVACLDCGKRFEYDWGSMKRGRAIPEDRTSPAPSMAAGLVALRRKQI